MEKEAPASPGRLDDITHELADQKRPLRDQKHTGYKTLDAATPSFRLAKLQARQRLKDVAQSLRQPRKEASKTTPLRVIVVLVMDDHGKWYFQPDLERDRAELGSPMPCARPKPLMRSDLAVYMLHAPPAFLACVYELIDEIGNRGLAYYLSHEKMRFEPPPRHTVDTLTDTIVGPPAFIVDHYCLVVNLLETQRRHVSPSVPRSFMAFSTKGVYASSDYDDDLDEEEEADAEEEDSDSAAANAGELTIMPPEFKTALSSRSLPSLERNRARPLPKIHY